MPDPMFQEALDKTLGIDTNQRKAVARFTIEGVDYGNLERSVNSFGLKITAVDNLAGFLSLFFPEFRITVEGSYGDIKRLKSWLQSL